MPAIYDYVVLLLLSMAAERSLDYYVNVVERNIEESQVYQLPENAHEYRPINEQIEDIKDYDFIVVGSGTAGSIVSRRLAEIAHWKILVLEAGDFGNDFTDIPGLNVFVTNSKYSWGYRTTPQKRACLGEDGQCGVTRGKGVGGNTLLNGCRYIRGNKKDYDKWEANGNPGWSYEEVLPYFKKSENSNIQDGDKNYHGKGGLLNVEYSKPVHPFSSVVIDGWRELGYQKVDYNGVRQIGVNRPQLTSKNGVRQSTGKVFIESITDRHNIRVITRAYVTKILIDSHNTTTGVIFSKNKRLFRVKARKEVILCAGVFVSPQLLMLSGVGPRKHLHEMGITTKVDLPVGIEMNSQISMPFYFNVNYEEPIKTVSEFTKEYLAGFGQYTLALGVQALGFFQTKYANEQDVPDLIVGHESSFTSFIRTPENTGLSEDLFRGYYGKMNQQKMMQLDVIKTHLKSVGTLKLKSNDPYEYPEIDPNHFSHPEDMKGMISGIRMVLKLLNTKAFKKLNATLGQIDPEACKMHKYLSDQHWACLIEYYTFDACHHHSTCKMGPDGVVDANLRVKGVKNLRVVDASVMPYISGYPAAVVMMVAEKISDVIKLQNGVKFRSLDHKYFNEALRKRLKKIGIKRN